MTPREVWLGLTLALAVLGLGSVVFWQSVRLQDVDQAVDRFVALDRRVERAGSEAPAHLKEALDSVRRDLSGGRFAGALKTLRSAELEQSVEIEDPRADEQAFARMWPERSPERKLLIATLRDYSKKLAAGYDLEAAREALADVGAAARAGNVAGAKQAVETVRERLNTAALRVGFDKKKPPEPVVSGTSERYPPPEWVRQLIARYRAVIPRLREQITDPERQRLLDRVSEALDAVDRAAAERKDVGRLLPLVQQIAGNFQAGEPSAVNRVLAEIRLKLPGLPPAPPLTAAPPAIPVPSNPGLAGLLGGPIPILPFVGGAPADIIRRPAAPILSSVTRVGSRLQVVSGESGWLIDTTLDGRPIGRGALPGLPAGRGGPIGSAWTSLGVGRTGPEGRLLFHDQRSGECLLTLEPFESGVRLKASGSPERRLRFVLPARISGWEFSQEGDRGVLTATDEWSREGSRDRSSAWTFRGPGIAFRIQGPLARIEYDPLLEQIRLDFQAPGMVTLLPVDPVAETSAP